MAKRKRFTKALALRITAVGLFFGLGSFAVMHSIKNQHEKTEVAANQETPETPTNKADDVPVIDPNPENKIAKVSGTDTGNSNFSTTQSSNASAGGGLPGFQSNGNSTKSSFQSNNNSGQFAAGGSPPAKSTATQLPPFNQSAKKTPTPNTQSGIPTLPPFKSTQPATGIASNTTAKPPTQSTNSFGGSFNSPQKSLDNSATDSNKSLLPPMRPAGDTEKKPGSGFSPPSSFAASPAKSLPSNQLPPLQPKTSSQGFSATPAVKSAKDLSGAAVGAGAVGATALASELPKTPAASPGGFASPKSTPPPSSSSFGANPSNSNSLAQPRTSPPTQPFNNTAQASTPTSLPSTAGRSSIPTGNASSVKPIATPQPRGALGATTMGATTMAATASASVDNVSQPTPGDRSLEGVQLPALAVQKIAPAEIRVNREAIFELIVKNTGRTAADNVQVHDHVPQGTQLVETIPPAKASASGQITWNLGAMAPGQQTSIKMKVLPKQAGNIGSVAHVTYGAVASAQSVCTEPKLSIRHEVPASVLLGQQLFMTIFVENNGNGAADNVVLQTDIPEGLAFATGQKELEYSIGTLPPGQSRRVQLPLQAAKVGQSQNVLAAHGAGNLRATDTVNIRVTAPKLKLASEGPSKKFLNRKATHTITLGNDGTAPATNLQLVARLPRGLQFTSANNQGQYDRNNHAVVWRLAKLDPQKSGSVEITTLPVATGQMDIGITAAADLNLRQQTTQPLDVQQLTELYFDIEDTADAIEVGTNTNFRVRIINQGNIPAKNVQAKVDFSPAIKPLKVQGGIGNQIQNQTVTLNTIPSLQPGQEISFVVTASALQVGDHRTVVSVKSQDRETPVSKEESTHVYSDR
ncbi:MAG: hypothetical protein P8I27_13640 [Pirellulaceae bacterium]|nr:hypothetical protein [Pirellulaceae bacterium]